MRFLCPVLSIFFDENELRLFSSKNDAAFEAFSNMTFSKGLCQTVLSVIFSTVSSELAVYRPSAE